MTGAETTAAPFLADLSGSVLRAVLVAEVAHHGQRYGDGPYVLHPIRVALQVHQVGGTEAQVVAALLHDTVEDTALTVEAIASDFGDDVAAIVAALTHDPAVSYDDYVDALTGPAVLVKLADSMDNLAGLPDAPMTEPRRAKLQARYRRNVSVLGSRDVMDRLAAGLPRRMLSIGTGP